MFSSGVDSSQSLNGPLMIPTRFVWPHGGRRVFLTGSFTRWSNHMPMSPMEDCPTVFQAICNLTPGLHQYKFYVDGEWRHDENQPCVSGNYGIVNSLLLTGEPESSHSIASPGVPGSMEVDSENFRHAVTISESSVQQAIQRISEADLEMSRHHISLFLSTKTSYDLLPDSGKVIALDVNLPVKQAFHILYEQAIQVAPLWDLYSGKFVGMLTALDFILIIRELGSHGSNLTKDELETHTISAWKLGKRQRYGRLDVHGRPIKSQLVHAGPYDSLKDVAFKILQNEVAMIPILHSSSPDESCPQLLHLATLSEILRSICMHFQHSSSPLPLLQQPIQNILLGSWAPNIMGKNGRPLAILRPNASIGSALSLLVQARISSIPIVDDNNFLLDTYSRSDITSLAKDSAYAQLHLDEMTIHQVLFSQEANSFDRARRYKTCNRSDSLLKVMELLSISGVRRVIVVGEGRKQVEGIISLSDVFRFLLG